MADKIFPNVRLGLKVDTLENWNKSTLGLKRGEVAFATLSASAGTNLTEPVVMMKIGEAPDATGHEKTFSELDWCFYAKASDVLPACKDATALTTFINNVIAEAGMPSDEAVAQLAQNVEAVQNWIGENNIESSFDTLVQPIKDALETIQEDYLTSEDKKELQDQITLNADAIERLANGVSAEEIDGVNDLIAYVNEHGPEVIEMQQSIQNNTDAIAAVQESLAEGGTISNQIAGLEDQIEELNGKAIQEITAGDGLKATKTGTSVAIEIDETINFIFDCGTSV